jgi:hypothetical protein
MSKHSRTVARSQGWCISVHEEYSLYCFASMVCTYECNGSVSGVFMMMFNVKVWYKTITAGHMTGETESKAKTEVKATNKLGMLARIIVTSCSLALNPGKTSEIWEYWVRAKIKRAKEEALTPRNIAERTAETRFSDRRNANVRRSTCSVQLGARCIPTHAV